MAHWPANDPDFWQMISERRRGPTIDRTELERRLAEYDASLVCYTFSLIVPTMRMTPRGGFRPQRCARETRHGDWEMRGKPGGFEVLFRRKAASLQEAIASAVADVESSGFRVSRIEMSAGQIDT